MSAITQFSAQQFIHDQNDLQAILMPRKFTEVTSANKNISSLADFCQGDQLFNVAISRDQVWKPKQSYFMGKFRVRVLGDNDVLRTQEAARLAIQVVPEPDGGSGGGSGGGGPLDDVNLDAGVWFDEKKEEVNTYSFALSYNAMATLFQDFKVSLSGQYLTQSNEIAHIDTLCKRMSGNKGINESFNAYAAASYHRRHKFISEPVNPENKDPGKVIYQSWNPHHDDSLPCGSDFSLLWRPSFGVLNSETLPAGDYRIEFRPQTAAIIKQSFVQSLHRMGAGKHFNETAFTSADYEVEIEDFRYYFCTERAAAGPLTNTEVLLDYSNVAFQQKPVGTEYESNISWDMPKGLHAVAIAFQAEQSYNGMEPFYSKTLFTVPYPIQAPQGPPKNAIKLDDFYFDYDGKTYPHRPYRGMGKQGGQYLSQVHMQNLIEQGNIILEEPGESLADFTELGPYLFFQMELNEVGDRRIQSNQKFTKLLENLNWDDLKVRGLLFAFKRTLAKLKFNNSGLVTSVIVSDK